MKDPKELEIIEEIEFEMAMQKGLTAALEESDERIKKAKANLLAMRERPIIIGS